MKKKITIALLGGRILGKKSLDVLAKYKKDVEVALVIAQRPDGEPDSDWNPPLLPYAKSLGFPTYNPKKLRAESVIEKFKKAKIDFLLNPFCNRIIPKEILDIPSLASINFHYGKLPDYKGRFIVSHMIANGEKTATVTAHHLVEAVDAGDIIFEKKILIKPHDTARSLYFNCTDAACDLLEKVLQYAIAGKKLPRKPQVGEGKYYPFEELNDCEIDLNWSREKIERFIRAVSFPPISYPKLVVGESAFTLRPNDDQSTEETSK